MTVARRRGRSRWLAGTVVLLAGVAASCATTPEPGPPVVVGEPVAPDEVGLTTRPVEPDDPAGDPSAGEGSAGTSGSEVPTTDPSPPSQLAPTAADAAAYVGADTPEDVTQLDHVVVDVDGDTWDEVVATGMRDEVGVVRIAWWTADGYEVLVEDTGGPGRGVEELRVADVNADGRNEVLLWVGGEGVRSLALWTVRTRGHLERLEAEGGCHDGSHVYGVTGARLEARQDAPPAVVASCDDSPLPVADWSEQRWVWRGDAYVLDEQPVVGLDRDDGDEDDGDDDGDEGDGDEGDGDDHGDDAARDTGDDADRGDDGGGEQP